MVNRSGSYLTDFLSPKWTDGSETAWASPEGFRQRANGKIHKVSAISLCDKRRDHRADSGSLLPSLSVPVGCALALMILGVLLMKVLDSFWGLGAQIC